MGFKQRISNAGFTIAELLVVMSIIGILGMIAFPGMKGARDQLRVTDDVRSVALLIAELRSESIRLKRNTSVTFTTNSVRWDYFSDGTIDGTYNFAPGVQWDTTPAPFIINGFGLVRGAATDLLLTMESGQTTSTISINMNGHVDL